MKLYTGSRKNIVFHGYITYFYLTSVLSIQFSLPGIFCRLIENFLNAMRCRKIKYNAVHLEFQ